MNNEYGMYTIGTVNKYSTTVYGKLKRTTLLLRDAHFGKSILVVVG
jgi:hypothetical protein